MIAGLLLACDPDASPGEASQERAAALTAVVGPTLAAAPTRTAEPTVTLEPVRTTKPTRMPQPVLTAEPTVVLTPAVGATAGNKAAEPALLTVEGFTFQVELALDNEQASRGLSYRELLPPGTGMLFVYPEERMRTFWMFEMKFPLDMLWIDGDCNVADLSENVPIPEPGMKDSDLPVYSPRVPVRHVFEINAGESRQYGIDIGDKVVFAGSLKGKHGC